MRNYLIALFMFMLLYGNANSQWSYVSSIPSGPYINSISVVDANTIWVCCDTGKVYKSTNGGLNWLQRNFGLGAGNLYGISALDTSNCWIGSVSGTIYYTSNGGYNWVSQLTVSGSFSDGIKMFNSNYGIYYGDPAGNGQPFQYRYTTNGGANWIQSPNAPSGPSEYGVLNGWDWLDTGRVWLGVANIVANATNSKVYRTATGFASGVWSSGLFGGSGTSQGLYSQAIGFTNTTNGILGTNASAFRKTTDGGTTWTATNSPPGISSYSVSNINSMKDGSNVIRAMIYSLSTSSYCFRTTNQGVDWTAEPLPVQASIVKIEHMQFLNHALGYAGGGGGVFIKYTGPSEINLANNLTPAEYRLAQNYPNPFNPSTVINFSIPKAGNVSLKIYDMLGKEICTLVNEFKSAGNYNYEYNSTSNMTSGIYFYTLTAGNYTETKKFTLIK
ncbi:MAG: T9SS type A sorting domain-containing protein [Ignavibacteria bacterium]|nr:T9SS type A sorting domain-containing protein [Ignavibacteria bacterium]